MKRFFEYSFFICFLLFLLLFPEESAESAKSGLMLWFYTLLPSMLPFMILSGILMKAGFIEKVLSFTKGFWKSVFHLSPMGGYGLLMGIFCGYPMGAKLLPICINAAGFPVRKPAIFFHSPVTRDLLFSLLIFAPDFSTMSSSYFHLTYSYIFPAFYLLCFSADSILLI